MTKNGQNQNLKQPSFLVGKRNYLNIHFVFHIRRSPNEISRLLFMWRRSPILLLIIVKVPPGFPSSSYKSYFHDVCCWQNECLVYCVAQGGFQCPSLGQSSLLLLYQLYSSAQSQDEPLVSVLCVGQEGACCFACTANQFLCFHYPSLQCSVGRQVFNNHVVQCL